jgi:uncharacterized protein (DUF952 family)
MALIYHVTTKQEWERAMKKGYYTLPSLETDGFIHCCEDEQVNGVLERYYAGKKDLVKLVVDSKKVIPVLKYELAPSVNEHFPHVYVPINLEAVLLVEMI